LSEFLKRATGRAQGLREDFRKLPRARRIALLLAAGAAVSLAILPFLGSRPGVLPETTAEGSPAAGTGSHVAPSAAFDRARELESAVASPSLWETSRQAEERLRDLNRQRVEHAIEQNVRIAKASLVLSRAPSSRSALQRGGDDSAALTINLSPGVQELGHGEADSIRSIVECAFGLRPERVSITDNFHRAYNDAGAPRSTTRVSEAQEELRLEVMHAVEDIYASVFGRKYFKISAIVRLSAERSSVEKIAMDPDASITRPTRSEFEREEGSDPGPIEGGLMAPPAGALRRVLREITEEKTFVSQSKINTDIPPGAVQGVSLTALFDLEAVERVIARDARPRGRGDRIGADPAGLSHALWQAPERSLAVAAFVAKQEEMLRMFLGPLGNPHVKVLVHPFVEAEADEPELPGPGLAAALPPERRSQVGTWVLTAFLGAGAIAAVLLIARRSSLFAGHPMTSSMGAGGWKSVRREHAADTTSLGEDVLRTVTRTNGAVRENPEAAASVLRFWLSQDTTETLGGQARS